jgi:hypothetical protein
MASRSLTASDGEAHEPEDGENDGNNPKQMDCKACPKENQYE